ncbi:putative oxidoreductase YcjS [Rubripirellula obstinata]|uniref:Putative oxidoreductase YcjS n=2 Tax=Rubripirellula obstinata TaxID=406547 RepID=A0A5B1CGJ7_9BACT|nr:putative oxidoreductase YcjS [Rubripirellula obstinata]
MNFAAEGKVAEGKAADEQAAGPNESPSPSADDNTDQDASMPIRIALVGAGGRGTGAVIDSLSINENVKLVAMADMDERILASARKRLSKRYPEKVDVAEKDMHVGIDSYQRILDDPKIDLVLMATPPGFRPRQVLDAVEAGKHVFAEKPTCVDPAGFKICLAAHDKAVENGTCIVTGTQYRRQVNYVEAIKRIHEGVIGDIVSATSRYCGAGIWFKNRRPDMSDTEYQIYNWMHHIWLSGDQIVEQSVHNIDAMNWIMGGPPESAYASGGRFTRPEGSEMWDSMSVDYLYPGNRSVSFKCRQIPGTDGENSNVIRGTKGHAVIYGINRGAFLYDAEGAEIWSMKGDLSAAYQQEHKVLVNAIRSGKPIVELRETSESSLTAAMGRVAAYTGKHVSWKFMSEESKLDLFPKKLDINSSLPEPKHAIPGKTKLV